VALLAWEFIRVLQGRNFVSGLRTLKPKNPKNINKKPKNVKNTYFCPVLKNVLTAGKAK